MMTHAIHLRRLVLCALLAGILAAACPVAASTYYKVRAELYTTSDWAELSVEGADIEVDWWAPTAPVNGLHVFKSPNVRLEMPCCTAAPATVELDLLVSPSSSDETAWTLCMGTYGRSRFKLLAISDGDEEPIELASISLRVKDSAEEGPSKTVRLDLEEITSQAESGESLDRFSSTYAEAETHLDIEYATLPGVDPRFLSLDLTLPGRDRVDPPPLVVMIHGGGMFGGDKQSLEVFYNDITNILGSSYAVASINYRLAPDHIFPAQLHDVRGAVQWLRAHADEYGYDGDRIGLWGFSAGGFLALLLGMAKDVDELSGSVGDHASVSDDITAICSYAGVADYRMMVHDIPWGFLDCEEGDLDCVAFSSPISHVTADDPPVFILHGTWDQFLQHEQAVTLFDLLQKVGVPSELVLVPGAMHGGPTGWWGESPRDARDFLDTYLLGD